MLKNWKIWEILAPAGFFSLSKLYKMDQYFEHDLWEEVSEIQITLSFTIKNLHRNVDFTEGWLIKYLLVETG